MVIIMAILTDDADYDADETSGNIPRPRSYSGYDDAYNGLRARCVPLTFPTNMIKLQKRGQTTAIQRKETTTTQKATPSLSSYLRFSFYSNGLILLSQLEFIARLT
ncbi:unnamed protein product [Protopolystoma xenopodis]|uniref:Uncharacterized protein n=1 Tax=Protopolystoma xenopodis TaxID=117903 RepID=A0A3S4ZZT8_9PLAT|nr:unnamed protein product [Protopolystoma xenopodis]